jgi:PhnB protein
MADQAKPVPAGYHTLTPYLIVDDAARAIAFYKAAFGAEEIMRMPGPQGRVGHAEVRVGDSPVMLADEFPEMGARSKKSIGGSPVMLYLYVADVDAIVERAVAAGAKLIRPVEDQFYGDRVGAVEDPAGLQWFVSTHKEDIPPEELRRRAEERVRQYESGGA